MGTLNFIEDFTASLKKAQKEMEKMTAEEYIAAFASMPFTRDDILGRQEKTASVSDTLRSNGNVFFSCGDYEKAALIYTCSLMDAPPYSQSAALAYGNRSAVLIHVKKYKECISDIDRALDLPYPDILRPKLLQRKESALAQLKDESNPNTVVNQVDDIKFVHGESSKLPGISRGIDVAYNPQEGRKLIARMPYQAGDIMAIAKPFITVRSLTQSPRYCYHCLKMCGCVIPCDRCTDYAYCSEECRAEAYNEYHSIECKLLGNTKGPTIINRHRAVCNLRCLIILTERGTNLKAVNDVFEEIEKNTDHARLGFTGEQFIGHTIKGFLSLPGKQVKDKFETTFEATLLIMLLRNHTNFFERNADIPIATKLLIKIYEIYEANMLPRPTSEPRDIVAYAIYPLMGLAKHACVNNTIAHVDNDGNIVLRASQSIRPGEEIQWNFHDLDFHVRMVTVRSGQAIQCKRVCERCDKKFLYHPERYTRVKLDKKLRSALEKNPHDINALWRLLSIVRGRHQRYTLRAQIIKNMLVDAYEGHCDSKSARDELHVIGVL